MNNVEKYADSLITMRCLELLFFNFTQEDIKELKKVREFDHVWSELEAVCEKEKRFTISDLDFFNAFNHVSYKTQAEIVRVAFEKYETEASKELEFSQRIKAMFDKKTSGQ